MPDGFYKDGFYKDTFGNLVTTRGATHPRKHALWLTIISAYLCLTYSIAYAQKTCAPIVSTQNQNCLVTITISGGTPPYTIQRQDGSGPLVDITTTTAAVVQNSFTDTGNMAHAYNVLDSAKQKSNVVAWTTTPIVFLYPTVPPDPEIRVVLGFDTWTLGNPTPQYPGNYEILRNGKTIGSGSNIARGSRIALCEAAVYIFGRSRTWYRWLGGTSWTNINSINLPCDYASKEAPRSVRNPRPEVP